MREKIREYLEKSSLTKLERRGKKAIRATKPGKSLSPDELTIQYYKMFATQLDPKFVQAFNGTLKHNTFTQDSLYAYITVLLKAEKKRTVCKCYRPISH